MPPRAYSYTTSKGVTFFLHAKDVPLPNGREQRIYYFRRDGQVLDAGDAWGRTRPPMRWTGCWRASTAPAR